MAKVAAPVKSNTAPKSKPMPDGKSVHASEPTREPNWTPRRVAIVKAMRALGATTVMAGATPDAIAAKASKAAPELADRVDLVKIVLDVYRTAELVHNGFAKSCKLEGDRGNRYYLTTKGVKTEFPVKAKVTAKTAPVAKATLKVSKNLKAIKKEAPVDAPVESLAE